MLATIGKVLLGLWMVAIIIATFAWLHPADKFQVPALARILIFHVPNAMVASIVSFVSAYFALIFLLKRRPLDDIRSHAAASLAILFWLLTTITGMVFAKVEWGAPWNWAEPKQACMFILLLVYVSYFALRSAFTDENRQAIVAAAWTLFAGILAPFLTYVLPNAAGMAAVTLHPKDVVFSSDGMSADYKIVFWSATLCVMGLAYWMYCMRVALETIALEYRRRALSPRGTV